MSSKKIVVQRAVMEIFNKKNLAAIDDFISENIVDHSAPEGLPAGIEGYRMKVTAFVEAFPDLNISYSHQIAEGDMVAGRFTLTGTHKGDFVGIAATGKKISVTGHDQLRVKEEKIAEHWVEMDMLGMMQQLGVIATA